MGLGIPATGTPGFVTTGVELEWRIRVGFVTPRAVHVQPSTPSLGAGEHEDNEREDGARSKEPASGAELRWDNSSLLEEIGLDDRGVVLAAAQRLPAESFEVQVPVRVYGSVTGVQEGAAWDKSAEEGMAI